MQSFLFKTRVVAVAVLATSFIATAVGTTSAGASKAPYVIGITAGQSGPLASIFEPPVQGFQTYIDHVNAEGGVNGHQIKLDILNDAGNVSTAATNFQTLVNDGSLAILGSTLSNAVLPLFPRATALKIPTFAFSVTTLKATPYQYGLDANSVNAISVEIPWAAKYLVKKGEKVRVAIVAVDTGASAASTQPAVKLAESMGWKVVSNQVMEPTATSFAVGAAKIKAAKANLIISDLDSNTTPIAVPAVQAAGVTAPFVAYWAAASVANFQKIDDPNFYAYYDWTDPTFTSKPGVSAMLAQAKKAGITVPDSSLFTGRYLLAETIVAALKKCSGTCTGAKLNAALQTVHINAQGLAGAVGFTATNHTYVQGVNFYHWVPSKKAVEQVGGSVNF